MAVLAVEESEVTPWAIRRHPQYANGVFEPPSTLDTAQKLLLTAEESFGNLPYLGSRHSQEGYVYASFEESIRISRSLGTALCRASCRVQDRVCIFSENRLEWIYLKDAAALYGFVLVGFYNTFADDVLDRVIGLTDARFIFTSQPRRVLGCASSARFERIVVLGDGEKDDLTDPRIVRFRDFISGIADFDPLPVVEPNWIYWVPFSSGTTGEPKGVLISHRSFMANLIAIYDERTTSTFARQLIYLPLCHVFQFNCASCALVGGTQIALSSGDLRLLSEDLGLCRPTVMIVVPRVLQRIDDSIQSQVQSPVRKAVFWTAWRMKRWLLSHGFGAGCLDSLVFNRVKRMLGGSMEMMVNGGAALPPDLHERLQVIFGWPIRAGWGQTEGCSGNSLQPKCVSQIRFGTSGYPLKNVELRIIPEAGFEAPAGHLLMGGSGLCGGYFGDPEATGRLFVDDERKWLRTGDIAKWDANNELVIVDRASAIFKLGNGEFVAAEVIGQLFEEAPAFENVFAYGDASRPFLVAVVVPAKGFEDLTDEAAAREIEAVAARHKLLRYQVPRRVRVCPGAWTVENGALSPTFKPKRQELARRYAVVIEELYRGP